MTAPFGVQAAQPVRQANGYVQMPGGYTEAIQQAQPQVANYPTQLGLPPQMVGAPQQFQIQEQGQIPLSQIPQQVQQLPQMRQIPQQGQQFTPQQQAGLQAVQQGPPQHQQPALDLNTRLVGQNIPPELQGRTLAEALAIHNGLRQVHLQSMAQQQPQQQGVPQQQIQAPAQPGEIQWDWKKPQESVGQIVEQKLNGAVQRLEGMLAPVINGRQMETMQQARNTVAQEVGPLFGQIESVVLQRLQGIDPRALVNPATWRIATDSVIGEMARRGILPNGQQQQQQQVPQTGGMFPAQQVPQYGQPLPNLNGFFSEQPNQGGPGAQGTQLTALEIQAAQAMGQSLEQYAAWKGGVPVNQYAIQQRGVR